MDHSNTVVERYKSLTATSAGLMAQAATVMPGGNTRTTSYFPPYPLVLERGEGPWLWDVDGRRYVDLFCNGLSLIHGNDYPPVSEVIRRTLRQGAAWPGTSRVQIAYAELLQRRLPVAQHVRFTNSGSEATMLAVKVARHVSGRPYILKAVGAYHGSYPDLEAGLYGQGNLEGRTLVAQFNDLEDYQRLMERYGNQVAAIIIEPVLVTGRVVAPSEGFLQALQDLARRHGSLTILDDCLMLRLAVGGSCEKFAIRPDIIALGKFIGGGTPLGAIGASRELMRVFDPTRRSYLFHGGSFNGNPVGCAAGLVTLNDLTAERIARMDAACAKIRIALQSRTTELGLAATISGVGSVVGISFDSDPKRHEDDPSALGAAAVFHLCCAAEGALLGPGGIITLSTAHDDRAIGHAIEALSAALGTVSQVAKT